MESGEVTEYMSKVFLNLNFHPMWRELSLYCRDKSPVVGGLHVQGQHRIMTSFRASSDWTPPLFCSRIHKDSLNLSKDILHPCIAFQLFTVVWK